MCVQSTDYIRTFAKKLELMKLNNIDFLFYEMLPVCGIGTAVAYSRFLSLHKQMFLGSYALINSNKKEHTDLRGENVEDSIWIRCMYLENAVLVYNSIVDYVYVVLYFNYNLYEILGNTSIKDKEDILKVSRSIDTTVKYQINKWLANQNTTKDFYTDFMNYLDLTKDLRELANDIKHRGHIAFEGMPLPRVTKVTKAINGSEVNITELVSPKVVNMDIEIKNLVVIHKHSFDIQKKLFRLCGFKDQLKTFLDSNVK